MIRVSAPNPTFEGERAGVRFTNGTAQVASLSGLQRQGLARLGYTIHDPDPKDYGQLTVRELRNLAAERGISLAGMTRKSDIQTAIETFS